LSAFRFSISYGEWNWIACYHLLKFYLDQKVLFPKPSINIARLINGLLVVILQMAKKPLHSAICIIIIGAILEKQHVYNFQ